MDLTFINTFLICCPSVTSRIKSLYGENFLKQQYYNSALALAKAATQMSKHVAAGVAGGVLGGAVTNIFGEYMYSLNYNKYLEATIKNPGVEIAPPKKVSLVLIWVVSSFVSLYFLMSIFFLTNSISFGCSKLKSLENIFRDLFTFIF